MSDKKIKIGFWGGPEYSVMTLEKLFRAGFEIAFVATSLDKPKGRDLIVTPPPSKTWAIEHNIPVIQPKSFKEELGEESNMEIKKSQLLDSLKKYNCDVYIVMAYGQLMPIKILNLPKADSLNIHPSLLPKFRGSCPIESAILADDKDTGVTIIQMDNKMDHGPIIAQKKVSMPSWPPFAEELGKRLVDEGAELLATILPDWVNGKIKAVEQDNSQATYTKKIEKGDGLIELDGDPYKNFLKIKAYHRWPSAHFFLNNKRIKITEASFDQGKLTIEKIIPEGKKEISYSDFIKNNKL